MIDRGEKQMSKHEQLMAKWHADPKFQAAYDALDEEFALFDEMMAARNSDKVVSATKSVAR